MAFLCIWHEVQRSQSGLWDCLWPQPSCLLGLTRHCLPTSSSALNTLAHLLPALWLARQPHYSLPWALFSCSSAWNTLPLLFFRTTSASPWCQIDLHLIEEVFLDNHLPPSLSESPIILSPNTLCFLYCTVRVSIWVILCAHLQKVRSMR